MSGYKEDEYLNIRAIANGTISGYFHDWIKVRPEARALLAEVERLRAVESQLTGALAAAGVRYAQAEARLAEHLAAHRTADAHDCAEMEEEYQRVKARLREVVELVERFVPEYVEVPGTFPPARLYTGRKELVVALAAAQPESTLDETLDAAKKQFDQWPDWKKEEAKREDAAAQPEEEKKHG